MLPIREPAAARRFDSLAAEGFIALSEAAVTCCPCGGEAALPQGPVLTVEGKHNLTESISPFEC